MPFKSRDVNFIIFCLLNDIYNEIMPLELGFQDRKDIYQLYPLLVHLVLFGSGYYRNVIRIVQKYS